MAITNGYTTGSAVKTALGIIDATSDTELELVIESVSRLIDDYCGRFFFCLSLLNRDRWRCQRHLQHLVDDQHGLRARTIQCSYDWPTVH